MWLFTKFGFYSIQKRPEDEHFTIRARLAADLDALREAYLPELSENTTFEGSDYPVRAFVMPEFLCRAIVEIVLDVDYSNFKMAVGHHQGQRRAGIYHAVWSNLLPLERLEADPADELQPGFLYFEDLNEGALYIDDLVNDEPGDGEVPEALPDWIE